MTQSFIIKGNTVNVFTAPQLQGTWAVVYEVERLVSSKELQKIAAKEAAPATGFYRKESSDNYQARFFNKTHEIQLCGHGLLSIAKVIADQGQHRFNLLCNDQVIRAEYCLRDDRVWIAFKALASSPVADPAWLGDVFSEIPESISAAGGDHGYWIMEWPQSYNLTDLSLNTAVLTDKTQRAVIATIKGDGVNYDYYFRYFAPQHGVEEDKATGSAHRVLISYWSRQLNKCNVKAKQLSNEGAELVGRYDQGDVWISGNVSIRR